MESGWNLSKSVILKHSGQEIFHQEHFVAFFFTIYMSKSLFCKDISVNVSLQVREI